MLQGPTKSRQYCATVGERRAVSFASVDKVAFLHEERGSVREGLRRDSVDGCEGVLDTPQFPLHRRGLRNRVIKTKVSDPSILTVMMPSKPVRMLQGRSGCQRRVRREPIIANARKT